MADQQVQSNSNFNLGEIFGMPFSEVLELIKNIKSHIRRIEIPKKDGSKRRITAPDEKLKFLQRRLYYYVFKQYKPTDYAHGFIARRNIKSNASPHVGATVLGKIDIKSFFDTISADHLKNCLFGNRGLCRRCKYHERMLDGKCHPSLYANKKKKYEFGCEEMKAVFIPTYCERRGYQPLIKTMIELCTLDGFTAQGFPTSPVLANIVMRGVDLRLAAFCKEHGIVYTRYADDLAFSSSTLTRDQLKALVLPKARRLLWAFQFRVNNKKISFVTRARRMRLCGVVINQKLSPTRQLVNTLRGQIHRATVMQPGQTTKKDIRHLKGITSFVMSIDRPKGEKYMSKLCEFERSRVAI